jgi:hypothetical protein
MGRKEGGHLSSKGESAPDGPAQAALSLKSGQPTFPDGGLTTAFRQYGGLSKGLKQYCKLHCRLALRSVVPNTPLNVRVFVGCPAPG